MLQYRRVLQYCVTVQDSVSVLCYSTRECYSTVLQYRRVLQYCVTVQESVTVLCYSTGECFSTVLQYCVTPQLAPKSIFKITNAGN